MPANFPAFSNATTCSVLAMTRLHHIFLVMFMFLLPILCEWLANAYRIARRLSRTSIRKRRQQSVARQAQKACQRLKLITLSVPDNADALCHAMAVLLASVRGAGNPDANMLCYLLHSFLCRHPKLCAATVSQDLHEGTIHKDAEYHMLPSEHTGYQVLAGMAAMFRLCIHVHNGQLPPKHWGSKAHIHVHLAYVPGAGAKYRPMVTRAPDPCVMKAWEATWKPNAKQVHNVKAHAISPNPVVPARHRTRSDMRAAELHPCITGNSDAAFSGHAGKFPFTLVEDKENWRQRCMQLGLPTAHGVPTSFGPNHAQCSKQKSTIMEVPLEQMLSQQHCTQRLRASTPCAPTIFRIDGAPCVGTHNASPEGTRCPQSIGLISTATKPVSSILQPVHKGSSIEASMNVPRTL